jgi:hypothetical protein
MEASYGRIVRLACDESERYRLTIFLFQHRGPSRYTSIISKSVAVISARFYDNRLALRDENMLRQNVIVATTVTSLGRGLYWDYFVMSDYQKWGTVSAGDKTWLL